MQLKLFDENCTSKNNKLLTDLFYAYYDARRNKRNTINQLKFEIDFESSLISLYDSIVARTYKPDRSICFIVQKPVKREIFAADFRDRVVHHLIYNYISPIFEKTFINDSYSCRKGKGTHYGIKRIDHFIRSCSSNYSKDCYILKLDIKGYFMAMNKVLLYDKVKCELMGKRNCVDFDMGTVLYLIEKTIFNNPTADCIVKGKKADWAGLPQTKSLFHTQPSCGLPIGNLTSQLFGNIYMNEFDHWVKRELGIKYYGRYVDDFVLIHENKEYLKSLIPLIAVFLQKKLQLQLHPSKIYFQHYSKGVKYLGAVIKPHRIYIGNRTKGNFYDAIETQNKIIQNHKPTKEEQQAFQSSMNSYLGIMKHYKTYKLQKGMLFNNLSGWWWNYVYLSGGICKFEMKTKAV
ncbi:MAG: reverse transcriptase/maturase family protein [Tenuifilaceae bacterium]|jgi:RNA-directed DNA polymerase|nr:reverse transcriptase/maturase family protein [Bacteroidales bacterium]MDI9515714.1 reverse transcriptase/maturase family protein [Bacteroidota bacterium]NLH56701.1 hypothetical protein [Rikenellaceae bacterium]OQC62986.1 MAG: Reverse transcriptase (RNA-dependent DNA polymerase) [Bacteroidetes bacterium ADurb.Bin008]HNV82206.1 reverse transcriptase/maturase family protein [Tenuifilaceae bacterium]